MGIVHDRGLAEDAAQEACIAISSSLNTLQSASAFRSWCYKIIVNKAISVARRRDRQHETSPDAADQPSADYDINTLDLRRALSRLSHKQRGAIILHYYVGLSSREIADATGLPRSTIRFHLMLARRHLRAALATTDYQTTAKSGEVLTDAH